MCRLPVVLALIAAVCVAGCSAHGGTPDSAHSTQVPHIVVDQFGYPPFDAKVAVIRNPHVGFDSGDPFTPGATYEVRRASDQAVVFSGKPVPWHGGSVEASSGDQGWWFDFSALVTPGRYFVYDVEKNQRSPEFSIDADVYRNALRAATRMYYYQRSGFAKQRPYADACWVDAAAYLGPDQDRQARDVTDRDNPAKRRDLSGGWFDAGDTNKYVTFASQPVHQLLSAYELNPQAFTDDFNIPESGNGVPDLIDEVRWETTWLKKMQAADGSVALKLGTIEYGPASPPSSDKTVRYYVPSCTSATIAAAGMFAHAAYVYQKFPALAEDAADLRERAIKAWNNYQSIPAKQAHCDANIVHAGNADLSIEEQNATAVEAAVYLSAITTQRSYHDYVKAHYHETRPYHDMGWSRYAPDQGESLLLYTRLPNADASLKAQILQDKHADALSGNHVYGFFPEDDLYRAFMHDPQYHWGSNNPRANYGNSNMDVLAFGIDSGNPRSAGYRVRALEILHYFHGVNPLGMVYLTNMYRYGVTRSVNEVFHLWYATGTKWSDAVSSECGPAPGYVPGGPNAFAAASGVPATLSPPTGQPPQKSYKDWNAGYPEGSWAITEPAIYYQSAYLKLLANFVGKSQDNP